MASPFEDSQFYDQVPKLERVADSKSEVEDALASDTAVAEHKTRTHVDEKLERDVEGVLQAKVADDAGIDNIVLVIIVPNGKGYARTTIEAPFASCPVRLGNHEIVDTVNMEIA